MATFPSIPPTSITIGEAINPIVSSFGDGYSQRYYNGINHTQKTFTLQWENINSTDGAAIVNFFSNTGKAEQFFWIDPDSTTWKVYLDSSNQWSAQRTTTVYTINATFIQDFDYIPS